MREKPNFSIDEEVVVMRAAREKHERCRTSLYLHLRSVFCYNHRINKNDRNKSLHQTSKLRPAKPYEQTSRIFLIGAILSASQTKLHERTSRI